MPPRAVALAGSATLAAVGWAGLLGAATYPRLILAAAGATVLLALGAPAWAYASALVAWLAATPLLAGLGPPANWPGAVLHGSEALAGGRHPATTEAAGAVAVVLWVSGGFWLAAAFAATRGHRAAALACAAAPWLAAVCIRDGRDAAWEGGAAVALAAVWLADRHEGLARRVVGAAAVVGVAVALVASPGGRWLHTTSHASESSAWTFDPAQTYGPLHGQRDGTVLMRVRSRRESYWRMRALDVVDSRGWRTAQVPTARLPEPGARLRDATVEIRALHSSYAVGPGRIASVPTGGMYVPFSGGSWRLNRTPGRGDTYSVSALSVNASAGQRAHAPAPTDPRTRYYLTIGAPGGTIAAAAPFGGRRDPVADGELRSHGYARALALARRLAAGADSEAEVVRRVHEFLSKYRYATDAPDHSRPLDAFLFDDREGSCQHFAGAAALLLRLAGVPARVAVGFAPGERDSRGRWVVRDRDAHAWVEVWYQGVGWVEVDPTPSGNEQAAGLTGRAALAPLMGFLLLGAWGLVAWRRRPHETAAGLLLRLARRTEDVATLRESAAVLGRSVGPRTAGLALAAERARYGESGPAPPRPGAVVRAVWADRGPIRATAVLAGLVLHARDSAT